MSDKVTDLDRHIAARLREHRLANPGVNMAQLARFLGVRYQSYQEWEKGTVSFRASSIMKVAQFYNVPYQDFIGHDAPVPVPNADRISYVVNLLTKLPPSEAGEVVRFAVSRAAEYGVK